MAGNSTTQPADEPIADVGIPTLGLTPYLLESIESVLDQTLSAWRLVISENGPGDDRLRSALKPYLRDSRVSHVVTGERVDRGENYTRLIRAGTAPYVGLLHDDDRWSPQFLKRRVEFLGKNPTCALVFSEYNVIDDDSSRRAASRLEIAEGVHTSSSIFPKLYRRMFVATPSVLVRRTAHEAVGARYKDIVFADHEMWLRLSAHFDIGYVRVWDADYRFHSSQTSTSRIGDARQSLLVLDAVEDLPTPRRTRRAGRSEAQIWCALDCVEIGARRQALAELRQAVRTDTLSVVRPASAFRMLAALVAMATGTPGQRVLSKARDRRWERRRRRGESFAAKMQRLDVV